MSTAVFSTTQHPTATGLIMPMERHSRLNQRIIIVLLAVLALHALVLLTIALMPPSVRPVPMAKPITIRMVSIVSEPAKPLPPKPIVKPKVVPIIKDLPKPKPLPILVAPKAAASPVVVAPVEKLDKPTPKVMPESAPAAAPVAAPAKAEPAPPKLVEGVAYLRQPDVDYPNSARSAGIEGTTLVRVLINVDGSVDSVTVQLSARNADLDRAALAAVKKTRFKPYRENGVAQAVYTLVPIQFSLDD